MTVSVSQDDISNDFDMKKFPTMSSRQEDFNCAGAPQGYKRCKSILTLRQIEVLATELPRASEISSSEMRTTGR